MFVAEKLGMSERTLTRRLAEEGVTFNEILQQLNASLAIRHLGEISRIAWLLGYQDASSFSHACRRWTGKSPREIRLSCWLISDFGDWWRTSQGGETPQVKILRPHMALSGGFRDDRNPSALGAKRTCLLGKISPTCGR
jgi:hypothetical protein